MGEFAFDKYWKEKQEYDNTHKKVMTKPIPAESPMFNHSILFKNIDDRDSMSDAELHQFIQNNFLAIMNNIFDRSVGDKYTSAFKEERFLDAFIDVLTNIKWFELDMIVKINLLIYHYITFSGKQSNITQRMMKMGNIVNVNKLVYLKKFNMPENLEIYILIARYSDFNLDVCVKRVNLILTTSQRLLNLLNIDPNVEAEQSSIDWLSKLFAELYNMSDWNFILPYFMVDVLPEYDEMDPNTHWITPDIEAMDSTLNLTVLNLLDTMVDDSTTLIGILYSYAEGYRMLNERKPIRFSFQNLSDDYPRIKNAVAYLASEQKIYVP